MGLRCPVCETPERDAAHLANHAAFTAMLGDADHEAWLDEHLPGWAEQGPAELGPRIAECAPDHDQPEPSDREHGHDHGVPPRRGDTGAHAGDLDSDAERILSEARELTAEMLDEADEDENT